MKKILILLSFNILLFATDVSDFINKHQCNQVINKEIYTVCYSYKYKGALGGWTILDGTKVNAVNIKKRPRFYENKTIPKKYRTKYSDYTGMGRTWNRGHFIIADADADYSQRTLNLVYDMSQIQPQAFYDKTIYINNITIPVGFYRVYYNDKAHFKKCFYYKNDPFVDWRNDKLKNHLIDCDSFEKQQAIW